MSNELLYEVSDGIAVITINRPERKNAINRAVRQALFDVWPRFEADDSAQIAILTGTGDTFCAGMDLIEAADTVLRIPPKNFMPVLGDNIEVSKPVIAAVQGYAYAGGWLLAQMCDLCVADETRVDFGEQREHRFIGDLARLQGFAVAGAAVRVHVLGAVRSREGVAEGRFGELRQQLRILRPGAADDDHAALRAGSRVPP